MTDNELADGLKVARRKLHGEDAGPRHVMWDIINDGEAILRGERSILSRLEVETHLRDFLK